MIITINDLADNINAKQQTDVILLDFSKVFDKLPHQLLIHKVNCNGISLENTCSRTTTVDSGVARGGGGMLGPLLFSHYMNDLQDVISRGSTTRLFADDCVLYHKANSLTHAQALQSDQDLLQK